MNRAEYNRNQTISAIQLNFIKQYDKIGIERIAVKEICEDCHISRPAFYRYFDDKYSVLESIELDLIDGVSEINRKLLESSPDTYQDNVYTVFCETAEYIKENAVYFKPLMGIHGDPHFLQRWKRQIRKDIVAKFKHDQVAPDNLNLVTELCASAIISLYTYWFFEDNTLSPEEIAKIAIQLLFSSLYHFDFS